jgi:hypothetical protein
MVHWFVRCIGIESRMAACRGFLRGRRCLACAKDKKTKEGGRETHISVLVIAREEGCENPYGRIFDILEGSLLGGAVQDLTPCPGNVTGMVGGILRHPLIPVIIHIYWYSTLNDQMMASVATSTRLADFESRNCVVNKFNSFVGAERPFGPSYMYKGC